MNSIDRMVSQAKERLRVSIEANTCYQLKKFKDAAPAAEPEYGNQHGWAVAPSELGENWERLARFQQGMLNRPGGFVSMNGIQNSVNLLQNPANPFLNQLFGNW